MSTIINGTSDAITFPDATIQNTSAIVSGKVPYTNLPAGSVLQVVNATTVSNTNTSSTSFVTTGFSASITPKFPTSKILVIFSGNGDTNANGNGAAYTVYRGGSNLGNAYGFLNIYSAASRVQTNASFSCLDSPATTSSTTYTIYFRATSGTIDFAAGCTQTLTLLEVAG